MSRHWDLSVGCWTPSWCAITSISLLDSWISLGHVEMAEASETWPQRRRSVTHQLTPWCAPARREWCRAPGSPARPAEAPQAVVYVRLLIAFWQKGTCFPHPLQPPPQNPAFCHLPFFSMSMLMNSWQISDSHFHSFAFTDGNILAYLKKKMEVDTFWKFGTKMWCISFNIFCIICRWETGDQFKTRATTRLYWNFQDMFVLNSVSG